MTTTVNTTKEMQAKAIAATRMILDHKGFENIEEVQGYESFDLVAYEDNMLAFIAVFVEENQMPTTTFGASERVSFENDVARYLVKEGIEPNYSITVHMVSINVLEGDKGFLKLVRNAAAIDF